MKVRKWKRPGGSEFKFTELGFGSAPLGNLYRAISDEEAQDILDAAWDAGCRYFDTAPLYGLGLAETRLNRFLRTKKREEYVLSTKVGRLLTVCPPEKRTGIGKFFDTPSRREVYDYTHDGVMRSLGFSLERLGVDRIDILFAHDLDIFTHGSREAMDAKLNEFMSSGHEALVNLRETGVIKAFGAGINEWQPAQEMTERGDPDLFLLAGRYTLLEQEALTSFLPLCEDRGIGIVLGGPFNSGILATGARKGAHFNYDVAPPEILEKVGEIETVCSEFDVPLIAAALQFPLRHPSVVSVIPGGQSVEQVRSSLQNLGVSIPREFWSALKSKGLMREDAPVD